MNKNQSQPASDAPTRADDEPVSDFVLQKSARRGCIYHEGPGIRYSEELKKWVVTSPELIRQAMYDDAFSVHTYDVSPLIDKLGVDLHSLNELCKQFPLATEGERHRPLREKFARHVAAQTRGALDVLTAEVDTRLSILARKPDGAPFCLHEELLKPALRKTVLSLAGIDPTLDVPIEDMPQLFDCFLPVSRRVRINTLIRDILGRLPGELSLEDKYFRIAVVALASNTTLSSVSLTIADRLRAAEGTPLKDIDWGSDFVRTGLPLIEKWAVKDAVLGGQIIRKGEQLRLFIEAAGVSIDGSVSFNDLFFAAGNHKCVGMSFSKQLWMRIISCIAKIDRKLRLLEIVERRKDYIFNLPERIQVEFHV